MFMLDCVLSWCFLPLSAALRLVRVKAETRLISSGWRKRSFSHLASQQQWERSGMVKTLIDFFFFFFFFTQVQTPVTLCSGEWWSILVVRLAHSADLRSRLRHVSSAPSVAYSTGCSRVVTHPGTNPARRCLTSVIWREPVCHRRLAVVLLFFISFMQ